MMEEIQKLKANQSKGPCEVGKLDPLLQSKFEKTKQQIEDLETEVTDMQAKLKTEKQANRDLKNERAELLEEKTRLKKQIEVFEGSATPSQDILSKLQLQI